MGEKKGHESDSIYGEHTWVMIRVGTFLHTPCSRDEKAGREVGGGKKSGK